MKYLFFLILPALFFGCSQKAPNPSSKDQSSQHTPLSLKEEWKQYWYDGKAEITSYALSQSRYGELREGKAVMIFVTEDFDPEKQVKTNQNNKNRQPVLKLNWTRDFNTGIYPYKIMSSSFLGLSTENQFIKNSTSIQEWCGHTYMQMNRKENSTYHINRHSYFEGEADSSCDLSFDYTEDQFPLQLRIDPNKMPVGELNVLPSSTYLQLKHLPIEPLKAKAKLAVLADGYMYSIRYTNIDRIIAYRVEKAAPYRITNVMERYTDNGQPMVSTASLLKSIKSDYWNKNQVKDSIWRDSLSS